MSHCVCGHPEEAHLFGGRCRVPGCECDQFCPIPELSVEWLTCCRRPASPACAWSIWTRASVRSR
jgi:hypothetical protein